MAAFHGASPRDCSTLGSYPTAHRRRRGGGRRKYKALTRAEGERRAPHKIPNYSCGHYAGDTFARTGASYGKFMPRWLRVCVRARAAGARCAAVPSARPRIGAVATDAPKFARPPPPRNDVVYRALAILSAAGRLRVIVRCKGISTESRTLVASRR